MPKEKIQVVVSLPPFTTPQTDSIDEFNKPNVWEITSGILDSSGFVKSNFTLQNAFTAPLNFQKQIHWERGINNKDYLFINSFQTNRLLVGDITSTPVWYNFSFNIGTQKDILQFSNSFDNIYIVNGIEIPKIFNISNNTLSNISGISDAYGGFDIRSALLVTAFENHLFLLNTKERKDGVTTHYPNRVRWSELGNPGLWKKNPDGTGEASFSDLERSETILGAYPFGRFLYVFTDNNIYAYNYIGGEIPFFTKRHISDMSVTGSLIAPQALAANQNGICFVTGDGIYMLIGGELRPIITFRVQTWREILDYIKADISNTIVTMEYAPVYDSFLLFISRSGSSRVYAINDKLNAFYRVNEDTANAYHYTVAKGKTGEDIEQKSRLYAVRYASNDNIIYGAITSANLYDNQLKMQKTVRFGLNQLKRFKQVLVYSNTTPTNISVTNEKGNSQSINNAKRFDTNLLGRDFTIEILSNNQHINIQRIEYAYEVLGGIID